MASLHSADAKRAQCLRESLKTEEYKISQRMSKEKKGKTK